MYMYVLAQRVQVSIKYSPSMYRTELITVYLFTLKQISYLSLKNSPSSLVDVWPCFMLLYKHPKPWFFSPCQIKQKRKEKKV